jgi:hypothetical protein
VDLECSGDLCRDSDIIIERYVAYYFYPGSREPSGTGRESPAADRAQHRAFAVYAAQLATEHVRVVLARAICLPTVDREGARRYDYLWMIARDGVIAKVFHPIADTLAAAGKSKPGCA